MRGVFCAFDSVVKFEFRRKARRERVAAGWKRVEQEDALRVGFGGEGLTGGGARRYRG